MAFIRLLQLLWVAARYDLRLLLKENGLPSWPLFWAAIIPSKAPNATSGEKLALALQALGPAFIKLGQTLATRFDLLGVTLAKDLAALQDRLPPFPHAERIVEASLDAPIDSLFQQFESAPVAAASIAQVHRAITTERKKVAVKVARPGVAAAFARDIRFFYWLAALCERWMPSTQRLRLTEVVEVLERSTRLELDLRLEAASADMLAENLRDNPHIFVPRIDWKRTSEKVLTLEWVEGTPLTQFSADTLPPEERTRIAEHAIHCFFDQVFRDGFFHADLHAGNAFILPDGRIGLVDFGIMGRLDMQTRLYLAEAIAACLKRDYARMAEVHFNAGYVPANQDRDAFTQACRSIGEPILDRPLAEISIGKLLGQLFAITETFDMHTQPQLLLLQKSLVLIESMCRKLDPNINLWAACEAPIRAWMEKELSLQARAQRQIHSLLHCVQAAPQIAKRLENLLEHYEKNPQTSPPIDSRSLLIGLLLGIGLLLVFA
jgi:ubiquinone biosynthesis protein